MKKTNNRHARRKAKATLPGLPKPRAPAVQVGPARLPNAKAKPRVVQVQLREVTQTEVGSVCPACEVTIIAVMPQQVVVGLRGGARAATGCGACGQPLELEYRGEQPVPQEGPRILTPGQDMALRIRGR